ncbi:hypothetical protein LIER_37040 [Lithospermum erythrorhizon]|uniref:Uncharacterized protein n=1 Tax=Lithospermum erythrorhizon TaxID=34254 RepID=A0AAV3PEC4_LITER
MLAKTKHSGWRFGNDKGKILDKIRVPSNIPTSEGVAGSYAKSIILGRLGMNQIFEEKKRFKFVLHLEAKDIALLGRMRDVDLPRVATFLYGDMEAKWHAKKEAKRQAKEEAKRKEAKKQRKLEKRAARGPA